MQANDPITERENVNIGNLHNFLVLISEKFPEAHSTINEEQLMMLTRSTAPLPMPSHNIDHEQVNLPETETDRSVPSYSGTNKLSGT